MKKNKKWKNYKVVVNVVCTFLRACIQFSFQVLVTASFWLICVVKGHILIRVKTQTSWNQHHKKRDGVNVKRHQAKIWHLLIDSDDIILSRSVKGKFNNPLQLMMFNVESISALLQSRRACVFKRFICWNCLPLIRGIFHSCLSTLVLHHKVKTPTMTKACHRCQGMGVAFFHPRRSFKY